MTRPATAAAPLAAAALVMAAVLALPPGPGPAEVVIEGLLLLGLLCLLGRVGQLVLAPALWALALQKLADLAMAQALGRGFNIVTDLPLLPASLDLIAGSFGRGAALGAVLAVVAGAAVLLWLLWRATGIWAGRGRTPGIRATGLVTVLLTGLLLTGLHAGGNAAFAQARIEAARQAAADLGRLRRAAEDDALAARAGLLGALDRDLLVIFVESYGRASFDVPLYAGRHMATLRRAETRLARAGLAARSGFLTAPTQGGQSWLSHATFASGLWIADQGQYRALLSSDRQTLFHLARGAGFRTAAVMPAITRPWPEAGRMGFDRVLAAADLGYRGKPFDWVTMPDQFTLAAVDRLLRDQPPSPSRPRLAAQVALISSHAPWTPVPRLLAWDRIGDGSEFDAMAVAGDPVHEVWSDRDRLRRQYREAVDYALRTALDHAVRNGPDGPLIFLLGDHQAAPGIAMGDNRDVALHVIGPPALVARTAAWGFAPGLLPPEGSAALPMDRMRDLILTAFSDAGGPA